MSSKLDVLFNDYKRDAGWSSLSSTDPEKNRNKGTLKRDIKKLIIEIIGQVEERETDDMSLQSWTPEDYKAFGKNELKIELIQKVKAL